MNDLRQRKQHPLRRAVIYLAALFTLMGLVPTSQTQGAVYKSRIKPHWSVDNSHFWYRNDLAQGQREFVLVDVNNGSRRRAFDHERLAKALVDAGVKNTVPDRLPIDDFRFDLAGNSATFRASGRNFLFNTQTHELTAVESLGEKNETSSTGGRESKPEKSSEEKRYRPSRNLSPDGKWRAFVRDHNLFVSPTDGGDEIQLSKDGRPGNSYQAPYWAGNSKNLIAFRVQPDEVGQVHLLQSSPPEGGRAKLRTRKYALPGDKFTTHELNWFDVAKQTQNKPDVGLIDLHGPSLRWTKDGRHVRYQKIDRGHQRFRVIEVDMFTGGTRNIIDETSETFIWTEHTVDLGVPLVTWLNDDNEIVYVSEQDGWRHLYLVDVTTGKQQPIAQGEFVVRYVDMIDEENRQIWFRASGKNIGQDPCFIHYYCINFDGSGLVALTDGDGDHSIEYSPDRRFIIDKYSRVDMAPIHELRRVADGKLICELEKADITEIEATDWEPPEVFTAKGRDGKTDIWGIICRPKNFDPKKKYPVLENMYAGPHNSYVPKRFSEGRRYSSMTDLGFAVAKIDGMGTANRSKAFHDVCWKNLKDAGFADRILWHQAVAAKYPWYDISRVGIYGGSAGGQSSTGALLFHPGFYKVAVSSCGCHDNRMDKASWNEQWMGYPVGPQYAESSNIDNAHRLRGKLMLIVGELDDNVPPESTMRLISALIAARKDFELVVVPNFRHGDGGAHGERKRIDFFNKHLRGVELPDHNALR